MIPRTNLVLLVVALSAGIVACHEHNAADTKPSFIADLRMVAPFAKTPTQDGKLHIAKGKLRVDFGPIEYLYVVDQKKGWTVLPEPSKSYFSIGEKQVSTFLPPMTNGSPCPLSERPADCKMVAHLDMNGRPTTKWDLVNHNGVHVSLWTDDGLGIAVRWEIENVTYQVSNIQYGPVADDLFDLPRGYTAARDSVIKGTFLGQDAPKN